MKSILRFGCRLVCASILFPTIGAAGTNPTAFQPGDRWAVFGDSITQGGFYHRELELFYLTRLPEFELQTFNHGCAGDTASGGLKRLEWDCLSSRPTVVTVLFGMNDVGRDLYLVGKSGPEVEKQRAARTQTYADNLRSLVRRLRDAGIRVVVLSPTPYDDTMQGEKPNAPGCNAALANFTALAREIAREAGVGFINLHTPLTELNHERQRSNPAFTLISADRVHPGRAGHLAIAYHILRAQGAPGLVYSLHLDAVAGNVLGAENAHVSDVVATATTLSFTVAEEALPFPLDPPGAKDDLVPFSAEFNRQLLRVAKLAPGSWSLAVDDEPVVEFTHQQLAAGVDLAALPSTPQLRQARLVRAALGEKWEAEASLRSLAYARHGAWPDAPRPFDPAEMQARVDARRAAIGHTNPYIDAQLARHAELQPRETELQAQSLAAATRAREVARPGSHHYTLTLLNPSVKWKHPAYPYRLLCISASCYQPHSLPRPTTRL